MTIIRKQITVFEEIDDGLTLTKSTEFPNPIGKDKNQLFNYQNPTEIPESEHLADNLEEEKPLVSSTIGRTFPDLFVEFLNNPRVITIILLFLPFPFFASNIKCFRDIQYPLVIGIGLAIVWFSFSVVWWCIKKNKEK